jgi:DNA repair exonuclease SbcCD ATPase subunit
MLFSAGHGEGKTLTIDSIIKMLFGKGQRGGFQGEIDRVTGEPSGYVKVKDRNGNMIKMPEEGDLPDFWQNLSSSDFRNVFVIRESDISLLNASSYYRDASERITGIRTPQLASIRKALKKIFFLTRDNSKAQLQSTQGEDNYLGRRVRDEAPSLLSKIKELKDNIEEKSFEEYELRIQKIKERIAQKERELQRLEQARKRRNYEKGIEALQHIGDAGDELEELDKFTREQFDNFKTSKNKLNEEEEKREELKGEIQKLEDKIQESEKKLNEARTNHKKLEKIRGDLDERLEPKIKELEGLKEELAAKEKRSDFLTFGGLISAGLLAVSIIGLLLSPVFWFDVLTPVFLVLTLLLGGLKFHSKWQEGRFPRKIEEARHFAARLGLGGEALEDILKKVGGFRGDFKVSEEALQDAKVDMRTLQNRKQDRDSQLDTIKRNVAGAKKKIDEIKEDAGVHNVDEYKRKLEEKGEEEKRLREAQQTLKALFGSKDIKPRAEDPKDFLDATVAEIRDKLSTVDSIECLKSLETVEAEQKNRVTALMAIRHRKEELAYEEETSEFDELFNYWNGKVKELEEYRDKATDIEYNEGEYERISAKIEEEEQKKQGLEEEMAPILEEMDKVEEKANEALNLKGAEKLPCETLTDLEKVQKKIKSFVTENERKREDALAAMGIFEKIEEKEKEKIAEILKEVSSYFSGITGGRFEEVKFKPGEMRLQVKEKGQDLRDVHKLSGGEKDQLYFSVRLALAQELLGTEKGIFILDDPFIKASTLRSHEALKTLLDMVKKIAKDGWQILYFTAKAEVVDELAEDIESGLIQEIPVAGVE